MSKKEQSFKTQESIEQTPRPNLLDVVKIDGRWAQVYSGGNYIKYLNDQSEIEINWNEYRITKNWEGLSVYHVKKQRTSHEKS